MRYLNQNPTESFKEAILKTGEFKRALMNEITFFANYWKPNQHSCYVRWVPEEDVKELKGKGLYGSSEGMYLVEHVDEDSELYFYLPQTTDAYNHFYDSIAEYHISDNTLFFETIPYMIDIKFDGKNEVELTMYSNVEELGKEGYESAVRLAKEMMHLLTNTVHFESFSFYEGDDDGNVGFEKKHSNYYVGIKISFKLQLLYRE